MRCSPLEAAKASNTTEEISPTVTMSAYRKVAGVKSCLPWRLWDYLFFLTFEEND